MRSWVLTLSCGAAVVLAGACAPRPDAVSAAKPPAVAPPSDADPANPATTEPAGSPTPESRAEPAPPAELPAVSPAVRAAVQAADRSAADRELDVQRKPELLLSFFGIEPGMRVAELGAGGGYTTELLARVVGANGQVYGQNSRFILERFAQQPWSERLQKPVMQDTVRLDREFDAPFPEGLTGLDAVIVILFYHDTVWFEVDRAQMNRAVYDALEPGGIYGIVDHSAQPGDGVTQAQTLHRIEEEVVRREVIAAGFTLAASGDFLRNPADSRDWNASPRAAGERRGSSDRFALKFVKPAAP